MDDNMNKAVEEEEEDMLVYMDFNTKMDDDFLSGEKCIKIIGLEEDKPILQIGNQVFRGEWRDTMGTHIFLQECETPSGYEDPTFSEAPECSMEFAFKTEKNLHMSRVFLNSKKDTCENQHSKENEEQNDILMTS